MTATNPSEAERQEPEPKKAGKKEPKAEKKRQTRSYMSELADAQQRTKELEMRINIACDLIECELDDKIEPFIIIRARKLLLGMT